MDKKDLLIASAARLYSMGIDLEAARDRLRQLVEQGVPNKEGSFGLQGAGTTVEGAGEGASGVKG